MQYLSPMSTKATLPGIVLAVLISGCGFLTDDEARLSLHLQGGFVGEHVRVEVDATVIYDSTAVTNNIVGFADLSEHEIDGGRHTVLVEVDGEFTAQERFWLDDRINVGVSFYRKEVGGFQKGIHLTVQEESWAYF